MRRTNAQPAASTMSFPRVDPTDAVIDFEVLYTPEQGLC